MVNLVLHKWLNKTIMSIYLKFNQVMINTEASKRRELREAENMPMEHRSSATDPLTTISDDDWNGVILIPC